MQGAGEARAWTYTAHLVPAVPDNAPDDYMSPRQVLKVEIRRNVVGATSLKADVLFWTGWPKDEKDKGYTMDGPDFYESVSLGIDGADHLGRSSGPIFGRQLRDLDAGYRRNEGTRIISAITRHLFREVRAQASSAGESKLLGVQDIDEVLAEKTIIPDVLREGDHIALMAEEGAGKSTFAEYLAFCLGAGIDTVLGPVNRPLNVMILESVLTEETDTEVNISAIAKGLGQPRDASQMRIKLMGGTTVAASIRDIERERSEHGIDLFIHDDATRNRGGDNLNDSQISAFYNATQQIGGTHVYIEHLSQDDIRNKKMKDWSPRGFRTINQFLRLVIAMKATPNTDGTTSLKLVASKESRKPFEDRHLIREWTEDSVTFTVDPRSEVRRKADHEKATGQSTDLIKCLRYLKARGETKTSDLAFGTGLTSDAVRKALNRAKVTVDKVRTAAKGESVWDITLFGQNHLADHDREEEESS